MQGVFVTKRIFVVMGVIAVLLIVNSCNRAVTDETLSVTALQEATFSSSLVSIHSDKCIEAGEARTDGAVPLVQKTCTDGAARTFDFHPVAGKENVYILENAETGGCLDVSSSRKTDEGSPIIQQFECHGEENQQLELKPQGDAYALVGRDQTCVDVQRNSRAEGAPLHAWDCNGGNNQAWQIDTVPTPTEPPPVAGDVGLDARPANESCLAPKKVAAELGLQRRFAGLSFEALLGLKQAPSSASYWYALEKAGRVLRFPDDDDVKQSEVETVIDLRSKVSDPSEAGLLGLAFHPDFADNGYVYLHYNYGDLRSRISRFSTTDGGRTLASSSEKTLLDLDQPYSNHNGGDITFGPDGYLYISFGDGGSQGDPRGNAQNKDTLLGSILRIDVDGGDPYTVPADNPFVGDGGAEEIFAYGLRNPWRMSFDRETGDLWSADVGQNTYEEVNFIESGKNYGWNVREGRNCYEGGCSDAGFTDPVHEYNHDAGKSVTGGYVYRGSQVADLVGTYVYGDYVSGTVWGLSPNGSGYSNRKLLESGLNLSSFAESGDGELYALDFGGDIYQFTASATEASLPEKLSETGCVDAANPTEMASGVIPYEVALPFWSDGAEKNRWFALPDGTDFTVDSAGDWELPPGGVSIKEFRLGGKRVETRFYVRHTDGSYSGYTYEWNDAQTDATLLTEGKEKDVGGQTWIFPSSAACNSCHTQAAGNSLGLETRQLNRPATYPSTGRTAQQIATLKAIGILPASAEDIAAHPAVDDSSVPATVRAQAYLDVNCSSCHRPSGPGGSDMDLRSSTSFSDSNTCNVSPTSGDLERDNAKLIVPGSREDSVLWIRLSSRDESAMPPLGSSVHDESGSAFLGGWIDDLNTCSG